MIKDLSSAFPYKALLQSQHVDIIFKRKNKKTELIGFFLKNYEFWNILFLFLLLLIQRHQQTFTLTMMKGSIIIPFNPQFFPDMKISKGYIISNPLK